MTQMVVAPGWAFEQLSKIRRQQPEKVDEALNHLLQNDPDLRWSAVITAYLDKEISLGKAAELLGLHSLELREKFIELGIPIYLGPANLAEAQAEVDAIKTWFPPKKKDNEL